MEEIVISKFKATCLKLLTRVKKTGAPLLVTKRGEPIALVMPPPPRNKSNTGFGVMARTGKITGDIVTPLAKTDWEVLED